MVASRPGSPYTGGRPQSSNSVHTKVEEDLYEFAGIDYDKVIIINTQSRRNQTTGYLFIFEMKF